jgi:myosin heavy subunit
MKEHSLDAEDNEGGEWGNRWEWLDPAQVKIDSAELHWRKITPDDAKHSFQSLLRMQPFLANADLQTDAGVRLKREELSALISQQSGAPFSETDLRFFDLYFGGSRIKVEKTSQRYDVINGRHRLWLAQQEGVPSLPVWLAERNVSINSSGGSIMSREFKEVTEIEDRAKEEQEEADQLGREIEEHKRHVEKLSEVVTEIKSSQLSSDRLRKAQAQTETAQREAEHKLDEARQRKMELLQENDRLAQTIQQANQERRAVMNKVAYLRASSTDASGEIGQMLGDIYGSLSADQGTIADAEDEVRRARQKIEELDI